MRLFCHVNELGPDGWQMIPAMLMLADDVVLWSPAATELRKLKAAGRSPFNPEDILGLMHPQGDEAVAPVKIASRLSFIQDSDYRNRKGAWEGQKWDDEFDGRVKKIFEDEDKPSAANRSIIILGKERGYEWAEGLKCTDFQYRKAMALVESDQLPLGTSERIRSKVGTLDKTSKRYRHAAVIEVLRDARNHEDARCGTDSNIAVHSAPFPVAEFNEIAGGGAVVEQTVPDLRRSDIRDFFKWVGKLPHSQDIQVIRKARDPRQREVFGHLLASSVDPRRLLLMDIESRKSDGALVDDLFGSDAVNKICSWLGFQVTVSSILAFFATLIISAKTTPRELGSAKINRRQFLTAGAVGGAVGAGTAIVPPIYGGAKHYSLVPDDQFKALHKWVFMLAFNTLDVTRAQIDEICERLAYN